MSEIISISEFLDSNLVPLSVDEIIVVYTPLVTVPVLPVRLPVTSPATLPVRLPVTSPATLPVKLPVTSPATLPVKLPVTTALLGKYIKLPTDNSPLRLVVPLTLSSDKVPSFVILD